MIISNDLTIAALHAISPNPDAVASWLGRVTGVQS
jgi:hypothetical protein